MKEKDIQKKITNKIKKAGGFVHKISDDSMGTKPFDFFAVHEGVPYYCELKMMKGTAIAFNSFRENQIAALLKIEENRYSNIQIESLLLIAVVENNKLLAVKEIAIKDFLLLMHHSKRKSISKKHVMILPEFKFSPMISFSE